LRQKNGPPGGDYSGRGIFLYNGNLRFTRDENGNIDSITSTGTRSGDLCDAVA
jgi:hypothetical protein